MVLIIAIIVSVLCVIGTHKLVATMAGDDLIDMYIFYLSKDYLLRYFMWISAMYFGIYLVLTACAYITWIR